MVIDERDRHKTAFTWKVRSYQYIRLAFGLASADQMISRCISNDLAINKFDYSPRSRPSVTDKFEPAQI